MTTHTYHVANFTYVPGDRGVLCLGPTGAFVLEREDRPVVERLFRLRGSAVEASRLPALLDIAGASSGPLLESLTARGLLHAHNSLPRGFSNLVVQTDDERMLARLTQALQWPDVEVSGYRIGAPLPRPNAPTVLLTHQSLYWPGLLDERRQLDPEYFQLNSYSLGQFCYVEPLYTAALGTPCHRCFVGHLVHSHAAVRSPDGGNWLLFEATLREFAGHLPSAPPQDEIEVGLIAFHLHKLAKALLDGHGPRLRPEDHQSILEINLASGESSWRAHTHWELCDCIQLDQEDAMR